MRADEQHKELKEYATAVIVGIVSNPESGCNTPRDLAHYAFDVAEAMMKEAAKRYKAAT